MKIKGISEKYNWTEAKRKEKSRWLSFHSKNKKPLLTGVANRRRFKVLTQQPSAGTEPIACRLWGRPFDFTKLQQVLCHALSFGKGQSPGVLWVF